MAGLIGAGRSETAAAIFGADPLVSGTMSLGGVPLRLRNDDPNTGRFFFRACTLKEQPKSGNLLMQWSGVGYGQAGQFSTLTNYRIGGCRTSETGVVDPVHRLAVGVGVAVVR